MTTRKTGTAAIVILVGLATAWAWAVVSETEPEGTSEIKQLKQQIADLEKRVERLEKQRSSIQVPGRPFEFSVPIPRNWHRREFNGQPYYLIPLGQTSGPETEPNGPGIRKGNRAGQQRP